MSHPYSWDTLETDPEQAKQMEAHAHEIASLYRQTFDTPAGRKVLEHLDSITLRRPVLHPDSTQFYAGIREGQNDLVRQIHANIEFANGAK